LPVNISASAKLLAGADDLDHFLVARGRHPADPDPSRDDHVEAVRRLALAEQVLSVLQRRGAGPGQQRGARVGRQFLEQETPLQRFDIDLVGFTRHGWVRGPRLACCLRAEGTDSRVFTARILAGQTIRR